MIDNLCMRKRNAMSKKKQEKKILYDFESIKKMHDKWNEEVLNPALKKAPERDWKFTTISGVPVKRLYTPLDLQDIDFEEDILEDQKYWEFVGERYDDDMTYYSERNNEWRYGR